MKRLREGKLEKTLEGCLQADKGSEAELLADAEDPGFGSTLLSLSLDARATPSQTFGDGVHQLALVVLKKYVKEHWHESAKNFQGPVSFCPNRKLFKSWKLSKSQHMCLVWQSTFALIATHTTHGSDKFIQTHACMHNLAACALHTGRHTYTHTFTPRTNIHTRTRMHACTAPHPNIHVLGHVHT